ncbi:hypothetical protein C7974DRAFT_426016 [Boeremia exigua]|uniref:uncharacterized protein n=1 Tax=Boeremia exigua TaxID=749465 RepID=UPI001E8E0C8B|nr:uncharacterized protein C7974DRAFT_426016 [Boeremia exigua]KAH6622331.1 hypothetical protein C7974DRAFT_426016 [Boeremia exigua]
MSKKWTPELDSILLHGVFEECQISFGKALCEKIAERVRNAGIAGFTECTPKAVENRLYSWKKKNATTSTGAGTPDDTPVPTPKKAAAKPKKDPTTPKTPRAKKGAKKAEDAGEGGEDDMNKSKSPTAGRKRAAGSEEEHSDKKVKLEPTEEE